jgi:hypothetical protein
MFSKVGRPAQAQALVRVFMATCWLWLDSDDAIVLAGVHWWDDLLLRLGTGFHNLFVAPFQVQLPDVPDVGFPMEIIEVYDERIMEKI